LRIVSGPATIESNLLTITGAGTVTVRASQAGDQNYGAAADVDRSFAVMKANQRIIFELLADKIYGDPPFMVNASASSGLPVSLRIVSGPATITGNVVSIAGAGTVTVRASQAGNANFNAAPEVEQTFTAANPVPLLARIGQRSARVGSPDVLLDVEGQDFVPQAIVRWNGAPLATTFVSRTLIRALLPSTPQLATVGVGYVTVFQGAPGGGTSRLAEFFVNDTGAPVSGADTATSADGGATATVGGEGAGAPGSLTATITGSGSVTVAQYEANPGPAVLFESANAYAELFVPPGSTLTGLTILDCNLNGGNVVMWSNGATWMLASPQTFDPATGCVTIAVGTATSPALSDLNATYLAGAIDSTAPATTAAGVLTSGNAYSFGAWTNQTVAVALHAIDNTGGTGLAQLTYSASGAVTIPPTTTASGHAALNVGTEGETTIAFTATDRAHNVERARSLLVRIDATRPAITAAATPSSLWPPNGKLVPVVVAGSITDDRSGVAEATYRVTDSYGAVQPVGIVTVGADGRYVLTLQLPAEHRSDDRAGRRFVITILAKDRADNATAAQTEVTVPHDRR
jgi:hypothetical protein